jgi:hypothetical protein
MEYQFLKFLEKFLRTISGEKNNFKLSSFCNNQKEHFITQPIFDKNILLVTKSKSSELEYHTLNSITLSKYLVLNRPYLSNNKKYYKYFNNNQIVYFRYNSFTYNQSEKAYIDSMFSDIINNKSKYFILDLRYNGGGTTQMLRYLLDYLTDKEYRIYKKYTTKISQHLIAQQKGYKKYENINGLLITKKFEPWKPNTRNIKFDGKLFLLTSDFTFSTAADMAAVVKDYKIGTLLGSETGGVRQAFGDILHFTTPNYKINFSVSFKEFYAPIPKADDEITGTLPDILLNGERLKRFNNSEDPELDFTIDYISNL